MLAGLGGQSSLIKADSVAGITLILKNLSADFAL